MLLFVVSSSLKAQEPSGSTVTFYVQWYDVGKKALEGLEGVNKVTRGFRGFREINTVYYDPTVITVEEMEDALKKAGTYVETKKSP
jgi:copper chaperone CopZ